MSTLLIMLAYYLFTALLTWLGLWIAARRLRFGKSGAGRAALVAGIWMILALLSFIGNMFLADRPALAGAGLLAPLLGMSAVTVFLIVKLQRAPIGKAFAAWGIVLGVQILFAGVYLVVGRRYLVEAYHVPTNSMAPTVVCRHATATCPKCGGTVYFDLEPEFLNMTARLGATSKADGTCLTCGQHLMAPIESLHAEPADRFFVAKYLAPQRWDVIAYHHRTNNDDSIYLKRVIGLPGDEIRIQADGTVMINGQPAPSPAGVPAKFPWLTLPPEALNLALAADQSLKLGPDDYFVIGDNAPVSNDSRVSGPIHSADFVGTATMIYWPPSRVRILR